MSWILRVGLATEAVMNLLFGRRDDRRCGRSFRGPVGLGCRRVRAFTNRFRYCVLANALDLPPITGISVACQAREESQGNGHKGAQREEQIEGTRLRERRRGHGGYPAPGK
jgi:hypothetical protein